MPGTVTSPTGSVKGHSLTGLVDAYTGNWSSGPGMTRFGTLSPYSGLRAQFQHVVLLSDQVGACSREGSGGSYAGSELTVRLTMIGYADLPYSFTTLPPAGDLPLTFTANNWLGTSEEDPNTIDPLTGLPLRYVHRVVNPYFMQASRNGGAGTPVQASAGTVTFTQADSTAYAGSYDLYWGTDHITGSFSAPWC